MNNGCIILTNKLLGPVIIDFKSFDNESLLFFNNETLFYTNRVMVGSTPSLKWNITLSVLIDRHNYK